VRVARSVTAVVIAALKGRRAQPQPDQPRHPAPAPGVGVPGGLGSSGPPGTCGGAQGAWGSRGGRLVVIGSAQTNQAVTTLIGGVDAFVGASDAAAEGTFVWSSGAGLTFTNWRAGEPNNANGNFEEDCVVVEGALGGTWDDRPCAPPPAGAGAYAYVCEY